MEHNINSILFISLSCVGDAVMTTPVLASLHARFPKAVIDIVSDTRSNIIYKHCPYRGRVFIKDKKRFLRGGPALLKQVRTTQYDLIVDLRTDGLAWLCRGRERLTKWNKQSYGPHAVERFMGVIRSLHGDREIPPQQIWLSKAEYDFADAMLQGLPKGLWLAMAPGNADERKIWPAENYAKLANALSDNISGVILDGSPAEKPVTQAVGGMLNVPFVDLAGRTDLLQAAAVLRKASLFVGGDSGLGHIAAAVATPTLTFFSVDRPERVLPWGGRALWLQSPDEYARNISLQAAEHKAREYFGRLAENQ